MRIVVDPNRCSGHARCNWLAPDLIDLDDEGFAVPREGPVPSDKIADAHSVRDNCPESAISLSDEEEG